MTDTPRPEPEAIHAMMRDFARFGATPRGGVHRMTATPADGEARRHLIAWLESRGLRPLVDCVGNVFGLLEWAGPEAPLVMTGSHLDSQPYGGRYDGTYGVVAACQAVAAIQDRVAAAGLTPACNFAVVSWTNEEGARFQPSLLGSGVYAGQFDADFALSRVDGEGVSLGEALQAIGQLGDDPPPRFPDAYIELHVECGPCLEEARRTIGVVRRHWGAVKFRVAFTGEQSHTGPTPMPLRRDALLGASYLIGRIRELADEAAATLYTSVGRIEVSPNSPNIVPARAALFVELRSPEPEALAWAEAELRAAMAAAAARARVEVAIESESRRPVGFFDPGLAALASRASEAAGLPPLDLETVGGHDAISMLRLCPSLVVNVPSVEGLCHNEREYTEPQDIEAGVVVLTTMLWELCLGGGLAPPRAA